MTPPAGPPREEGFSKDADKLIRRLSLVAFLLSRPGRPATTVEIRQRVEGYALMSDEAFKRRFYEDRSELAGLGIAIVGDADGEGEGEVYSLPASAYYLPAIELSSDELAALAACLFVLEHRFAYSEPLRLALLSLTHGRPELLSPAAAAPVSVLPPREARRAAAALPKLQQAVAAGKTVTFTYYSISRDQELPRTVDPYGLLLVGDEWYLIAHCHLRQAIRTFRLSRLRSRVTFATRAPHDFSPPSGFTIDDYLDRPAWRLGEPVGEATVRVSADMAWWVAAHYARCGTIAPFADGAPDKGDESDRRSEPGKGEAGGSGESDIVFTTTYDSRRQLLAWVLSMGEAAEVLEPPELRAELRAQLELLATRLADPPLTPDRARELLGAAGLTDGDAAATRAAAAPCRRPATTAGGADDEAGWQVEADRFTRLATLMTYLHGICRAAGGGDETPVPVADVCGALDTTPAELRADVRLLNLVNFGGEGTLVWAEIKGQTLVVTCDVASSAFARPARLSPLQVDTLLLAIEILGGQLPIEHGVALRSAAQKLRGARRAAPAAVAAGERLPTAEPILDAVNAAVGDHRLLDIEYWSEGSGETTTRTVEPYLLVRTRGEWYYVAWCRRSAGTRTFRVATTKRAVLRGERFVPRPEVEVELYRREGVRSSARYAPRRAVVWYGPAVVRWVAEQMPTAAAQGGGCLTVQPYADERWLTHELLRFGGEALPLAPGDAVAALRGLVERLLERYA
ncbi:MAG TPA: WYL domain-containing protein [Thermoleophilia bacterium]|nr:WYL domain-containing protein [Thermoleophilia bacterium]